MATTSRRSSGSEAESPGGPNRHVKKIDAAPTPQDVAAEAAAIYPDTFPTPPTPDEIAAEAYAIYMARGRDDGRDMDDWYEAERRLNNKVR